MKMLAVKARDKINIFFPMTVGIIFLVFLTKSILLDRTQFPMHDTLKAYPYFHFFIQNIQNGVFPLWSPYAHCGEPFWQFMQYMGMYSPIISMFAVLSILFRISDIGALFNWYIFLSILFLQVGTYLCVKELIGNCRFKIVVLWIISPIICFGTFAITPWAQGFTLFMATFLPFTVYLFINIYRNYKSKNIRGIWLKTFLLSWLISVQLNSFNPMFFIFFIIIMIFYPLVKLILFVLREKSLMLKNNNLAFKLSVFAFISIILLSLPLLILKFSEKQIFPITKYYNTPDNLRSNYERGFSFKDKVKGDLGTTAEIGDFIISIDSRSISQKFSSSEISIFIGYVGFFFLILGLLFARRNSSYYYLVPQFMLLSIISIGSRMAVSLFFYNYFPFFKAIRHLEFFLVYINFLAVLIVAMGIKSFIGLFDKPKLRILVAPFLSMLIFLTWWQNIHNYSQRYQFVKPYVGSLPLTLKMDFPYKGKIYNEYREFKVEPMMKVPTGAFRDGTASLGDFLLLYKDAVRHYDFSHQFTAPAVFWDYFKTKVAEDVDGSLGITKPKLQIINGNASFKVSGYDPGLLRLKIEALSDSILFYSQNALEGWQVRLNQKRLAEGLFRSTLHPFFELKIPKGIWQVEFIYRPFGVMLAIFICYSGQVVAFIVIVIYMLKSFSGSLKT